MLLQREFASEAEMANLTLAVSRLEVDLQGRSSQVNSLTKEKSEVDRTSNLLRLELSELNQAQTLSPGQADPMLAGRLHEEHMTMLEVEGRLKAAKLEYDVCESNSERVASTLMTESLKHQTTMSEKNCSLKVKNILLESELRKTQSEVEEYRQNSTVVPVSSISSPPLPPPRLFSSSGSNLSTHAFGGCTA